jgi:hypothetical protein
VCAPDRLLGYLAAASDFGSLSFRLFHRVSYAVILFGLLFFSVLTMRSFTLFLAAASLFDLSIAGYALEDDYMTDFYGAFDFFDTADPTNGMLFA